MYARDDKIKTRLENEKYFTEMAQKYATTLVPDDAFAVKCASKAVSGPHPHAFSGHFTDALASQHTGATAAISITGSEDLSMTGSLLTEDDCGVMDYKLDAGYADY
jgi:hypothetical protein